VDATNAGTTNQAKAAAFFCEVSRRLQTVATAQEVTRLVTLSIVGADRVPGFGYYQAKRRFGFQRGVTRPSRSTCRNQRCGDVQVPHLLGSDSGCD